MLESRDIRKVIRKSLETQSQAAQGAAGQAGPDMGAQQAAGDQNSGAAHNGNTVDADYEVVDDDK